MTFAARMVEDTTRLADSYVKWATDFDPDDQVRLLVALRECRRILSDAYTEVERELISSSGEKQWTVEGVGEVEVKGKVKRRAWDRDALRSAVLDSRLINEATGELVEETPLERICHVWNLGAPRVTALRERRIDPSEFCEETFDGWAVKLP